MKKLEEARLHRCEVRMGVDVAPFVQVGDHDGDAHMVHGIALELLDDVGVLELRTVHVDAQRHAVGPHTIEHKVVEILEDAPVPRVTHDGRRVEVHEHLHFRVQKHVPIPIEHKAIGVEHDALDAPVGNELPNEPLEVAMKRWFAAYEPHGSMGAITHDKVEGGIEGSLRNLVLVVVNKLVGKAVGAVEITYIGEHDVSHTKPPIGLTRLNNGRFNRPANRRGLQR